MSSRIQPNQPLNLHTVLKSSYKDPYDKNREMEKAVILLIEGYPTTINKYIITPKIKR